MRGQNRPEWWLTIDPARTAFFLDVDGTLLGFKDRPEDVVADTELLGLVERLVKAADGAVACVSGRRVDDLDRIMQPLVLPAGGVHGADLRFPDGRRSLLEGSALHDIKKEAALFVAAREGLRLEDKGGHTFALHFRQAPQRGDEVAQFLQDLIEGHDLMVQHGKMVAEVKPKSVNKGLAIETLMQSAPFQGRAPLFVGDDLTDEHGFAAVNKFNGLSIKVGTIGEGTVARHRLADTDEVRDFLEEMCRLGEGRQ